MHPHHASVLDRWLEALLFGERAALFAAAMTIIFAFWSSGRRYFSSVAHLAEPTIADKFGAGIWSATVGMLFTVAVRLALSSFWRGGLFGNFPLGATMMVLGVIVILGGYYLHFAAWADVIHPSKRHLALWWTISMVIVTVGGTLIASGVF